MRRKEVNKFFYNFFFTLCCIKVDRNGSWRRFYGEIHRDDGPDDERWTKLIFNKLSILCKPYTETENELNIDFVSPKNSGSGSIVVQMQK